MMTSDTPGTPRPLDRLRVLDLSRALAYAPIIHAEAGLIGRQADISGGPPADIAFALADALAGLHGTIAILAALRLRDRTGTGQHIDVMRGLTHTGPCRMPGLSLTRSCFTHRVGALQ